MTISRVPVVHTIGFNVSLAERVDSDYELFVSSMHYIT